MNHEETANELKELGVSVEYWMDTTLCLAKSHVDKLREQDLNAHYMPKEMFQQLSNNVRERGLLESLPLCWYNRIDQMVEIVSGHHRIRGFRSAQIAEDIFYLLETANLSREEVITKQLAHNSIFGSDDPDVLKTLFIQIESANLRIASYINPEHLNLPIPDSIKITRLDMGLGFKAVTMMFLPYQLEDFEQVVHFVHKDADVLFVSDIKHFDKFKDAVIAVQAVDNIKSIGTTIARMSEIVLNHYAEVERIGTSDS